MAENFKNSKTRTNLMRAFAGESQARNRYTFAASQAKKQQLNRLCKQKIFGAEKTFHSLKQSLRDATS